VGEQTGHVYVVDLVRLRPIDQWVQAGGPEDAMPLYTVVKGPHTGEVTGEQNGFSYPIPDDQAPVANQVRQTLHSPDFVGGCGERGVARVCTQGAPQTKQQIFAVVEAPVERNGTGLSKKRLSFLGRSTVEM